MRRTHFCLALLVLLLGAASVAAQSEPPPPPPPSPDYFPDKWKEFVFEQDNVKFRFPAEPEVKSSETKESFGTVTTHSYTRRSFILLNVQVTEYPTFVNFEEGNTPKELFAKVREGSLKENQQLDPKIVKESDVSVGGHPGLFMQVLTNDGKTTRIKLFVVRNRLYFCYAEVKTGEKHGLNFENDFEKVAMGFLDSVGPAAPAN